MLDFSPTQEQEEIRHLAHMIALERLRPLARQTERDGNISEALMQIIMQTGLTTPFPERYGGSGNVDAITSMLIAEELGYGDGGLAMNIIGSMMGPLAVALAGDEAQQEQYLPSFCTSEGYLRRGSFALAERSGGYAIADIQATLRSHDDGYSVTGTKRDVIHGGDSSPRVVVLLREGTEDLEGICAVVCPEQGEGMHIQIEPRTLGLCAAPVAAYTFEQFIIPSSALLPRSEGALRAALLFLLLRAGVACGTARAALEYASGYAKERQAFGRPIVSYQGIAFMIAEMAMKLDAARLLLWQAALQWDQQIEPVTLVRNVQAAQTQALAIGKTATIDAIQILGGAGFLQDHPTEMWMRNAATME